MARARGSGRRFGGAGEGTLPDLRVTARLVDEFAAGDALAVAAKLRELRKASGVQGLEQCNLPLADRKLKPADLMQAMFSRNSEAPIPILAASTPSDCFWIAFEACRIALKYMLPVIVLTDGYLANGAEPWRIPSVNEIPQIPVRFETNPEGFKPYKRNPETLARPWAIPGTPGLEHRIGGIEKQDITGNVSYDPENHHRMTLLRAGKVAGIANSIPDLEGYGAQEGDLLIVGWGSTYGALRSAVERLRAEGQAVGHAHVRYLNPFPKNTGEVLSRFRKVLVPELNLGQLRMLLRATYLVDAEGYNMVRGKPFRIAEIHERAEQILAGR